MKSRPFVVVADNHGDQIDTFMESRLFDWLKDYRPEIVIHAGDLFDFRAIRNGASLKEKGESMREDYEQGMTFAKRLFKFGKVRHWLRGNHDERIWDLLVNESGPLNDHAKDITRDIMQRMRAMFVSVLPYDARHGVLQIGHLQVIHGFHAGKGAGKRHAEIYRNVIFGHTHTQEIAPVESLHGPEVAMGTGCLCNIDMPYNARETNKLRHQQGWVYGLMHPDGTYVAHQAKRIGDKIYAAKTFKEY